MELTEPIVSRVITTETISAIGPEIVLVATATAIYVLGSIFNARWLWSTLAGLGLLASAAILSQVGGSGYGPLADDALGLYIRWLSLGIGGLFVLLTTSAAVRDQGAEMVGSLLLAISGMMLLATSQELVTVFLGLELISIPTYVLLYLGRRDVASQESALKYFFLNILASAMMLYGFSFLYGLAGSMHLADIHAALAAGTSASDQFAPLSSLCILLIFAGLGFKIAAAPFHFYAPDVYQGTTNTNAALLSIIPKIGGLVVMIRVLLVAMPGFEPFAWRLALILAILTMTVGNILALWQDNVRRLLAYSSIAHAGYMLIGLAVAFALAYETGVPSIAGSAFDGVAAVLLYMAVYAVATVGTFAALTYLGDDSREINTVEELAGLARSHPVVSTMMAVFMFSLAGIPPLAGFWGKLALFGSALSVDAGAGGSELRWWFVLLAIVGVLNAAIAAAYYLRIIGVMYFRQAVSAPTAEGGQGAWLAMAASALLVVGIGVFSGPLWTSSLRASRSLLDAPEVAVDRGSSPQDGGVPNVERMATTQPTRDLDGPPPKLNEQPQTPPAASSAAFQIVEID